MYKNAELFVILIFVIVTPVIAQTREIIFGMSIIDKNIGKFYEIYDDYNSDKLMRFSLSYNDSVMKFSPSLSTTISLNDYQMNLIYAEAENEFYKEKNGTNILKKNFIYGTGYPDEIIKYKEVKWTVSTEKKMILGHECYKATGSLIEEYNPQVIFELVAWYCPNMQPCYGPLGIDGLPGMILELKYKLVNYVAVKVITKLGHLQFPNDIVLKLQ